MLEEHPELAAVFRPIFEAHDKQLVRLAVTTVTLAGVLTGPLGARDEVLAERYRATLKSRFAVGLDAEISESAARLRAACKLKLADAVQAASALAIGADALVTHDRDFSALRALRVLGVDTKGSPCWRASGSHEPALTSSTQRPAHARQLNPLARLRSVSVDHQAP